MERWIQKSTLIGVALSIDHLGHLPALMSIYNDKVADVKYHGGMMGRLSFDSNVEAGVFLENKRNWENMFKWLRLGKELDNIQFERVAWIRIVGLPIKYWSEHIFLKLQEALE
ncbi:unnamed protein product [Lactuca virosa]|uniref:DUF4283 domain-containing protein n=1 Tax=Lactuca virosa TaxID=75947 RepID=A0AAU9M6W3_9ASTR|nr:unnamed protein product [Lactuca virosa]